MQPTLALELELGNWPTKSRISSAQCGQALRQPLSLLSSLVTRGIWKVLLPWSRFYSTSLLHSHFRKSRGSWLCCQSGISLYESIRVSCHNNGSCKRLVILLSWWRSPGRESSAPEVLNEDYQPWFYILQAQFAWHVDWIQLAWLVSPTSLPLPFKSQTIENRTVLLVALSPKPRDSQF